MPHGNSPDVRNEVGVFSRFGALCGAAIAVPAVLFASEPTSAGTPVGISLDPQREQVALTVTTNSGYTAIQAQVIKGNLSPTNWFNVPGGILSSNQTSLTVPMHNFPATGCVFRGVTDDVTSDLRIGKEEIGSGRYHIVVTVDDKALRNPDGSLNPEKFGHFPIENSTDGVRWVSSGYQVIPGGTQFGLVVQGNGSGAPFFMSRVLHQK